MTKLQQLKMTTWIIGCICIGLIPFRLEINQVSALNGSGAVVSQDLETGTRVNLKTYHAPGSERVVIDLETDVVASQIDDGSGIAISQFQVATNQLDRLQVFAVDQANQTQAVSLSGNNDTILLPPSIVEDKTRSNPDENRLVVGGYTYPGAKVTIEILQDNQIISSREAEANNQGEWSIEVDDLSKGEYRFLSRSAWGQYNSRVSLPLEVKIDSNQVTDNVSDVVERVGKQVLPKPIQDQVTRVAPQARQVATGVTPVASVSLLTQFALFFRDIFYFLIQGLIGLMQYFGFWKKRNPWGLVYDSVTKQPVMLATVRLFQLQPKRKLVETDVTTKEGVFSFMPPEGEYEISVNKPEYKFPSRLVTSRTDGEYTNVYHGRPLKLNDSRSAVSVSIPIDPDSTKDLSLWFKLKRMIRARIGIISSLMLLVGLIMSLISIVGGERGLNSLLLIFYLLVLALQSVIYFRSRTKWGVVEDMQGKRLEKVQVQLFDPKYNKLVQRRFTDEYGRYQFVVPPGEYQIRVESPQYQINSNLPRYYQGQKIIVSGNKPKEISFKIKLEPKVQ